MRTEPDINVGRTTRTTGQNLATAALVCGVLGVLAAVWAYWLVVPGALLGITAVVIGILARRRGAREVAGDTHADE